MGILSPVDRIFDTIITEEGKKQIASGKLKAEFYSFSDASSFYKRSDTLVSGSQDMLGRLSFECSNLPQDLITIEVDDSGKLKVKELQNLSGSTLTMLNGQIYSGSYGDVNKTQVTSSYVFSLLENTLDNFNKQMLLGTSTLYEDKPKQFLVFPKDFRFQYNSNNPIPSWNSVGNLDNIESLFSDRKLSHIPNYKFLPPINKKRPNGSFVSLGTFINPSQQPILEFNDLKNELLDLERKGMKQEISFVETSLHNRIVSQFFEIDEISNAKLDVIDFGIFPVLENNTTVFKHVFFVGKLFVDNNNSNTFVNMFTMVWE